MLPVTIHWILLLIGPDPRAGFTTQAVTAAGAVWLWAGASTWRSPGEGGAGGGQSSL